MTEMSDPQRADLSALRSYVGGSLTGDLFTGASPGIVSKWHMLSRALETQRDNGLGGVQQQVDRHIQELGMAFRLTNDQDERAWPLSPFPLLIGAQEWNIIESGLIQRVELIERILADIYGAQKLVTGGALPAAIIAGSRHFTRKMMGVTPPQNSYIHLYAVDLARGPDGGWRVLSDRLRLPTGVGYALENRIAISRSTGPLLTQLHVRRLADFFSRFREGIAADCGRKEPRIAMLTPGRLNQSYPEQAHLARYLGFLMVEGRDLVVSQGRLYVRTIEGLKHIDALWRWIDTQMIDPLNFDSHSDIGVPDLFETWTNGELVMANWPGVGVLESRAFSAFLPKLSETMLGRPLTLPNVATWWCGQKKELETVRANFGNLVISAAFGNEVAGLPGGRSRAGSSFSEAEKAEIIAAMQLRPMDYTGQEIVSLSTTPTLIDGAFEARSFTIRAFVARDRNGQWAVMPGGFARLSAQGDLRTSLMGDGDISADVCIVDEVAAAHNPVLIADNIPAVRRSSGILPSQAADNLYWLARYGERIEMTARLVRALLGSSLEADTAGTPASANLSALVRLLENWGAIDPKHKTGTVHERCWQAINEIKQTGSIAKLIDIARDISRRLRDRLAIDFWRIINGFADKRHHTTLEAMFDASNRLIDRSTTLAGLAAENMVRGPGWRFYDMGRRIERAVNGCRIARMLATPAASGDNLNVLLELFDSQISYRTRYLSVPALAPVIDLILLDPHNPRSLVFQLVTIVDHLERLPHLLSDGMTEPQLRVAKALLAQVEEIEADAVTQAFLQDVETHLLALSDAIARRYFLQFERVEKQAMDALLG